MKHTFHWILLMIILPTLSPAQLQKQVSPSLRHINKQNIKPPGINIYHGKKAPAIAFAPGTLSQGKLYNLDPRLRVKQQEADHLLWIDGTPEAISFRSNISMQEQIALYLEECEPVLQTHKSMTSFVIQRTDQDELGYQHTKLQQQYQGIDIYGAELLLHGKTKLSLLHGHPHLQPFEVVTDPEITAEQALQTVIADVPDYTPVINDRFGILPKERNTSRLVIYPDADKMKLAFHITTHNTPIDRWEYFIDARDGAILTKFQSICKIHNHDITALDPSGESTADAADLFGSIRTINTFDVDGNFYLIDASRPMYKPANSVMPNDPVGVIWTIDAFNTSPENDNFTYDHIFSANNQWGGKETGVSAHFNAGEAYTYFKNVHNRESVNGSGGNIISIVNITNADGTSLENAFWNGAAMFYGNGGNFFLPLARARDVAGHELTHGVIQNTANLEYQGESGALNESYADIFGAMIDRDDWLIGEDVVSQNFPAPALRSLSDPHNGAAMNNYGGGFQPKRVSEQFTGTEDNGGVHINSGIPNHAFFLFASAVGKEKAEQVYYRSLSRYMLRSSKFIDHRLAVIQSTIDLYGEGSEAAAARNAFDQVEIFDGTPGNYQEDLDVNPGNEYLLVADNTLSGLYLFDAQLNLIANPLSTVDVLSRPSITDDGQFILFIGADKLMYLITIDWNQGLVSEPQVLQNDPVWRNVIVSKDGRRIAATFDDQSNEIWVYDFLLEQSNIFELFNPTFTEGASTGDVQFSDAMEFDFNGEFIMYDALNKINGVSGEIEYWDIGFVRVWDNLNDIWGLGGIEKLFTALPEGISVGNPTFSKNSPYIIAFEVVEGGVADIYGANLETGELNQIFTNNVLNYPNFNTTDDKLLYDIDIIGALELGVIDIDATKINPVPNSENLLIEGARWGVWFANGDRNIVSSARDRKNIERLLVYPNPAGDQIHISVSAESREDGLLEIFGVDGRKMMTRIIEIIPGNHNLSIDVSGIPEGMYLVRLEHGHKTGTTLIFKQ